MDTLKALLKFINLSNFLPHYVGVKPNSGIRHRILGTSSNPKSAPKDMTPDEREKVKEGLGKFIEDITQVKDKL